MLPKHIYDIICEVVEYLHQRHIFFWTAVARFNEKMEREVEPHFPNIPQDVSLQPIILDYMNRKHIFAYNGSGSSITLNSDDNNAWKTVLPANSWTNISYPPNTRLTATSSSSIRIKCTDEMIP